MSNPEDSRRERADGTPPPPGRPRGPRSERLVLLDVPAHRDRPAERAVGLLLLVLALDLGEVEAELVDRDDVAVAAAAGLEARDQQVGERVLEELLLLLARL